MSFMVSGVTDRDKKMILAACPFYKENPLCVNSCALFEPTVEVIEGVTFTDYREGRCSLGNGRSQILHALTDEEEAAFRKLRKYE